jgi:hypothetical protein
VISYEDFDLRIQPNGDGLSVFARRGSQTDSATFELEPLLSFEIEDLELRGREAVEKSGAALFNALIRGDVLRLYQQARGSIGSDPRKGIRIRIHIDARDERLRPLVWLPWEILFDLGANTNRFLALDARRAVVRTIDSNEPPLAPAAGPPQRVLLAAANPHGSEPLDLDRECAKVEEALKRNQGRPAIVRHAARLPLHQWICDTEPQIVHFMGHGDLDPDRGEGVLILENENGDEDALDASTFASFFAGRAAPQLVILTSCFTAVPGRKRRFGAFSSVAAALVAAGLPAVIAMQSEIRDHNAILFTERLYRALMRRNSMESIEAAVTEARVAVHLADRLTLDWAAPVLFIRGEKSPRIQVPIAAPPSPPPSQYIVQGEIVVINNHGTVNQWKSK